MATTHISYINITMQHPSDRDRATGQVSHAHLNVASGVNGTVRHADLDEDKLISVINDASSALYYVRKANKVTA